MLTKKQRDLLELIHKRMQIDGVPPSFEEMKDALDLRSKSGVHRLITALEERGFIRRMAHRARALEIVRLPDSIDGGRTGSTGGFSPRVIDGDRPDSTPATARSVSDEGAVSLPLMGRIAAGVPIEAISQVTNNVAVPGSMLGKGEHYALEVKGESMIGIGINDGDVVVIRETKSFDNGDIVVALVEDQEATLKKIRQQNDMIALEAANPAFPTQMYSADQVKVQGRLVGLIRSY